MSAGVGCIVTTVHEGRIAGCYVSYVTACSMDPVRLARGQQGWVERFGLRLGHTVGSYSEPRFLAHVLGGIRWAAAVRPGAGATRSRCSTAPQGCAPP